MAREGARDYFKNALKEIVDLVKADGSYMSFCFGLDEVSIVSATAVEEKKYSKFQIKYGEGIEGWVIESGIPLLIPAPESDPRFYAARYTFLPKISNFLCLPISLADNLKGAVTLYNLKVCSPEEIKKFSEYIYNWNKNLEDGWKNLKWDFQKEIQALKKKILNFSLEDRGINETAIFIENEFKSFFNGKFFRLLRPGENASHKNCGLADKGCPSMQKEGFAINKRGKSCVFYSAKKIIDPVICILISKNKEPLFTACFEINAKKYCEIEHFLDLKDIQYFLSLIFTKIVQEENLQVALKNLNASRQIQQYFRELLANSMHKGIIQFLLIAVQGVADFLRADGATIRLTREGFQDISVFWGIDEKFSSKKYFAGIAEEIGAKNIAVELKDLKLLKGLKKFGVYKQYFFPLKDTDAPIGFIRVSYKNVHQRPDEELAGDIASAISLAAEASITLKKDKEYLKEFSDEIYKRQVQEKQLKAKNKQVDRLSARLQEVTKKLEDTNKRLNLLYVLSYSFSSSRTLEEVYKEVLNNVVENIISPLASATIGIIEPRLNKYVIKASLGLKKDRIEKFERHINDIPKILTRALIRNKKYVFLENLDKFPEVQAILYSKTIKSFYVWPIVSRNKTIGSLSIACKAPKGLLREDLELLTSAVEQLSAVTENIILYSQTQRHLQVYNNLHRLTEKILADYDYNSWVPAMLKTASTLFNQQFAAIILKEKEGLVVKNCCGIEEGKLNEWFKEHYNEIFQKVISEKESYVSDSPGKNLFESKKKEMLSWAALPLSAKEHTFGAIILGSFYPQAYTKEDVDLFNLFADRVTLGLVNSLLYNDIKIEKDKIEAIVKRLGEGLIILDRNRKIILFNEAAEKITGWKQEEVLGKECATIFKGRDKNGSSRCGKSCPVKAAIENSEGEDFTYAAESIILDKEEKEKIVNSIHSVFKFNNEVLGALIVFRDVTEERTLQQLKSDFIAGISHDLRTPLASIKGYAMALLRHEEDFDLKVKKEFLSVINNEIDHLTRLLDNLTDTSKIEAGLLKPACEEFILGELLEKVSRAHQLYTKKHRIKVNLPEEIIVYGDMYMIERILNNLVNNAIKYSPEGGNIEISATRNKGECLICVGDEGLGIHPEDKDKIFEKFKRGREDKEKKISGFGIGLYVVKMLVEMHGGRIWAKSREGKGSKFYFTIALVGGGADG